MVLKPDSQTPYCALACAELLYEAGLPRALYAIVPGPGSVVGTAIADNCDYLMFTGSSATGSQLAEHAGRRLIGFSAELGGKNAMIVAKGANLDKVAKAATRACFSNAGQLCISIERIYVEKDIADEFTQKFGDAVRKMKLGTAYDFSVDMGSLISEGQVKTVSGHVDDAKVKGAKVIAGGKARPDIGPLFYEPTVLTGRHARDGVRRQRDVRPARLDLPGRRRGRGRREGQRHRVRAQRQRVGSLDRGGREDRGPVAVGHSECQRGLRVRVGQPQRADGRDGHLRRRAARHGPEGLLKYTESQTIAAARVFNLDAPFGIPPTLWQKSLLADRAQRDETSRTELSECRSTRTPLA